MIRSRALRALLPYTLSFGILGAGLFGAGLLGVSGFGATAIAQDGPPQPPHTRVGEGHEPGAETTPARALPEFSKRRMMTDLRYLASPKLEGRGSGTVGGDKAARYLQSLLRSLRLQPKGGEHAPAAGPYLQPFDFTAGIRVADGTALALATPTASRALEVGKGFNPLGFSATGALDAEVVFCGYGISADEAGYDDYAGLDVTGKAVLVFDGIPGAGDNAEALRSELIRFGALRMKAMVARDHGAAALIVTARTKAADDPSLISIKGNTTKGDAGTFVIDLRRTEAAWLYERGAAGDGPKTLAAAQDAIDASGAPASRALGLVRLKGAIELKKDRRETFNVLALVPGTDPTLRGEVIVIGAHYDHLGFGESGGSLATTPGVHHGADDNASGTALVVEIARKLVQQPLRRSVLVALWSGEELGLLGSAHFVRTEPTVPMDSIVACINLDMVGRMREQRLTVGGMGTAEEWPAVLDRASEGLTLSISRGQDGFGPSDHSSFYGGKVPVFFLFTGAHEDYHTPTDTPEKINADGMVQIAELAWKLLDEVGNSAARPTYKETGSDPHAGGQTLRGPSVYLGTIPDYADTDGPGVRLAGVRPESPADRAGMEGGDRVVRFAGKAVNDIQDYTYALFSRKIGEEVEIIVLRGEAHERLVLTAIMGRKGGKPKSAHGEAPKGDGIHGGAAEGTPSHGDAPHGEAKPPKHGTPHHGAPLPPAHGKSPHGAHPPAKPKAKRTATF